MQSIDGELKDGKALAEALRGLYGTETMSNGIVAVYQGRVAHFSGLFDGSQETIEIPKITQRVPVVFTGDNFSCMALAEPNAGFVKVPDAAKGKRFCISATAALSR